MKSSGQGKRAPRPLRSARCDSGRGRGAGRVRGQQADRAQQAADGDEREADDAGEVGAVDAGDTGVVAAALRETREETGVAPSLY